MNKKLLISIIITVVYAIYTIIGVLHHEIWADEAQVWQLCKYMNIPELLHHLHNEGHPIFFYLLVMPFAKLTDNIIFMQLICWISMVCAVFILWYKSPFKWYCNLAITLSAGFSYFLPVVARSYSILPVLVFLAAILYTKQKEHPVLYTVVLSAIASTHVIMFGFCTILFCFFVYDNIIKNTNRKKYILPLLILLSSLLYVIWQLHDTISSNYYISFSFENLWFKVAKLTTFFFINMLNKAATTINNYITLIGVFPILISLSLYILIHINLLFSNKRLFFIALGGIGFQFVIYIFAYSVHVYVVRIFSALIILIFCLWIQNDKKLFNEKYRIFKEKYVNVLISLFFLLTTYNGFNYYILDMKYSYAPAIDTYEHLKNNIKKEDIIFTDNESFCISLVYYFDKAKMADNIYSVIRHKPFKYVIWDNTYYDYTPSYMRNYVKSIKSSGIKNDIYLIFGFKKEKNNIQLNLEYPNDFELVYETSKPSLVINEKHLVYKYIGS